MMKIKDFVPYIDAHFQGFPQPLVEQQTRLILHDFCKHAWVWRYVPQDPPTWRRGMFAWPLPLGAVLARPLQVWVGDQLAQPINEKQVGEVQYRESHGGSGRYHYYRPSPNQHQLALLPDPGAAGMASVAGVLALRPGLAETVVPDWLMDQHLDAIVCGVLGRLFLMPGQPWSSPELGSYHDTEYRLARVRAQNEAERLMAHGDMRTAAEDFPYGYCPNSSPPTRRADAFKPSLAIGGAVDCGGGVGAVAETTATHGALQALIDVSLPITAAGTNVYAAAITAGANQYAWLWLPNQTLLGNPVFTDTTTNWPGGFFGASLAGPNNGIGRPGGASINTDTWINVVSDDGVSGRLYRSDYPGGVFISGRTFNISNLRT